MAVQCDQPERRFGMPAGPGTGRTWARTQVRKQVGAMDMTKTPESFEIAAVQACPVYSDPGPSLRA